MGEPETTPHGTASLIKNLNEEYEIEYGDKLITEGGSVLGTTFQYDGRSLGVNSQTSTPTGLVTNGETLLLLAYRTSANSAIHQYSFGTKWDVSTLSYDNKEFTIGSEAEQPNDLDTDGDTLILTDERLTGSIFQYSFGSSWDVSKLSYDNIDFNTGNQDANPEGITTDGETVIVCGSETDSLYQYSMDTWDLSTLSYDNVSYDISSEAGSPQGAMSDGEYLLYVGDTNDDLNQYRFKDKWDLSTLEEDKSVNLGNESSGPRGIYAGNGVAIVSSLNPEDEILSYSYVPDIRLPERE